MDDRDIPFDEIEEVGSDYQLTPLVRTRIWVLRIDNGDDPSSYDLYADKASALSAFEVALSPYLSPEERDTFKGDPYAAKTVLESRPNGPPFGDLCALDEHTLQVTPDP